MSIAINSMKHPSFRKGCVSFLFMLFSSSAFAQVTPPSTETTKPGARWWWLGSAIDKENISWNMKQYADCGIGALEITPIYGVLNNDKNNIEFLSPQWMEILRFVQAGTESLYTNSISA